MNKLSIILLCFSFLSCIKNEKLDNNEYSVFLENFVELNKKKYDFNKVKFVSYGDSLAYNYWINDSGIDTIYLKKYFTSKNLLELKSVKNLKNYSTFKKYEQFDFSEYFKYKLKNPNSNFNEFYSLNFNRCELFSIQFIVFNEAKDKVLIFHSLDCTSGSIEVYFKAAKNKWVLLKNIARVSN